MRVRDIMTTKVITINSNATVAEADDMMSRHKIHRLPIVDNGKLVGLLTTKTIMNTTASEHVPIAFWKLPHFIYGRKVKEIMIRDVVTVTPDMTVEGAALIAQEKKVGGTVVVEGDRVVGIVTTNDYYYNILNPLMGVRETGQRLIIKEPSVSKAMQEVFGCIAKHNTRVKAMSYIDTQDKGIESDLVIGLDTTDATQIAAELRDLGYNVEIR